MKSYSDLKQPDIEVSGKETRIRFNHTEITKEDMDGESKTQWECDEIKLGLNPKRDEIIEAVVRLKYPTYGAELAAMRDPERAQEHEDTVNFAKSIADNMK